MEEDLVLILRMATRIHKSQALTLYLETCEPRFKQLPLDFNNLHHLSESKYLAIILEHLVGNPIHVYTLLDRLVVQLPELKKELLEQNRTNTLYLKIAKVVEWIRMPTIEDLEE